MTLVDRIGASLDVGSMAEMLAGDLLEGHPSPLREAAVLVAITDRPEPGVLLTLRCDTLRDHGGQIAFPGGRLDEGENVRSAALREAWEELALDPAKVRIIGEADHYQTITGFGVTPVVAIVPPDLDLVPNPAEVADWFEAPLGFLLDPVNHRHRETWYRCRLRHYYEIVWNERRIWGATAAMLVNLSRRLVWLDPAIWLDRPGIARLLTALGAGEGGARFVGGAVRDALLGLPADDIDLATPHQPDDVVRRLEAAGIKAVPTGIAHGTVTAVSSGTVVEVTTLRCDVSTDGRRATVAFTGDWAEDAARRDFTINALYADPASGEIHDFVGGEADIAARRVRFIGEPLERIAEDHLRILRFFRFHARFGEGEPDPQALAACAARANDLMALSRERIADELLKLLALPDPSPTVALMQRHAILAPVLPEIIGDGAAAVTALPAAERDAGIAPDPLRRLAALLPRDPALAMRIAARLKLSNKARARLGAAANPDLAAGPRPLAYRIGTASAVDRLLLADRAADAASIADWPVPRLPIGGGDLIARGVAQGPAVARTLRRIEEAWIAAGFPDGAAFDALIAGEL